MDDRGYMIFRFLIYSTLYSLRSEIKCLIGDSDINGGVNCACAEVRI